MTIKIVGRDVMAFAEDNINDSGNDSGRIFPTASVFHVDTAG